MHASQNAMRQSAWQATSRFPRPPWQHTAVHGEANTPTPQHVTLLGHAGTQHSGTVSSCKVGLTQQACRPRTPPKEKHLFIWPTMADTKGSNTHHNLKNPWHTGVCSAEQTAEALTLSHADWRWAHHHNVGNSPPPKRCRTVRCGCPATCYPAVISCMLSSSATGWQQAATFKLLAVASGSSLCRVAK
jgi:hypothetical protein